MTLTHCGSAKRSMPCLPVLAALFAAAMAEAGSLVTFSFTGYSGGEASGVPDAGSVAAGLTVSDMTRGAGIEAANWASGSNGLEAKGFSASEALNVADNDYFTFTLTPAPGRTLDLDAIAFRWTRSGSGPYRFSLRTSIEGWNVNLHSGTAPANATVTLPDTVAYNTVITPVEVRVYGYHSPAASHFGVIDDMVVSGTIPPPATILLLK